MLIQIALLAQIAGAGPGPTCEAAAAPALDHAIIVVRDLDRAADAFRKAGFRIKPGRRHANGLLNRHIKFRDGTEIELMTVADSAGDDMARRYANLLAAGEGGVYVALKVQDIAIIERQASVVRLPTRHSASGPWQFLGFTDPSPAAAVFFTAGDATVLDADSIFQHEPPVTALAEVWLEGGSELGELLRRLGAVRCGTAAAPDGRTGQRWALSRGSLVVVPGHADMRPRVLGAVLDTHALRSDRIQPLQRFWIQYR